MEQIDAVIIADQVRPSVAMAAKSSHEIKDCLQALSILQSEPSAEQIASVAQFLHDCDAKSLEGDKAAAARLNQRLVTSVLPDWWDSSNGNYELQDIFAKLVDYFRRPTPLGVLVSRLNALADSIEKGSQHGLAVSNKEHGRTLLQVLEEVFNRDDLIETAYIHCAAISDDNARSKIAWKDFALLISSGRVVSTCARMQRLVSADLRWLDQGKLYAKWLARNISKCVFAGTAEDDNFIAAMAAVTNKGLLLGYSDYVAAGLLAGVLATDGTRISRFRTLISTLPAYQQRSLFDSLLRTLRSRYLNQYKNCSGAPPVLPPAAVSGAAAFIAEITKGNETLSTYMADICVQAEPSVLAGSVPLQRAVLASMSRDVDQLSTLMRKVVARFGDELFIRRASALQQEAIAQMLLLTAGYVQRQLPTLLSTLSRSSLYTNAVSNRLKASMARARWLGMLVGMAVSTLTDKQEQKLRFDDESMKTDEAAWYLRLPTISDCIGDLRDLQLQDDETDRKTESIYVRKVSNETSRTSRKLAITSTEPTKVTKSSAKLIELVSDIRSDNSIIPYAKPDSDPEDEDEDSTLITRDKPKPPVYVRDLIIGLRDVQSYARHRLSLEKAASLIKRKANFGKEVSDHANELTSIIINLDNQFEMDDFHELRSDALLALISVEPISTAAFVAASLFETNHSLQQRVFMLSALALGARALAGLEDSQEPEIVSFPSQQLPGHLRELYDSPPSAAVRKMSRNLEQMMIEPLAIQAADQLSGPNALKVRKYHSKVEMERQNKQGPIMKQSAKIVSEAFVRPLVTGWWFQLQSVGPGATFSKHLLPLFVRTLAIVLSASGSSNPSLPAMTAEIWDILLMLRLDATAENQIDMLESLLFAFLTLLDLNEDKQRLANEHAKELVETQEWAKLVLDQVGDTTACLGPEEGKVKILAAGVVVRCHEVIERWQRLMLGDLLVA